MGKRSLVPNFTRRAIAPRRTLVGAVVLLLAGCAPAETGDPSDGGAEAPASVGTGLLEGSEGGIEGTNSPVAVRTGTFEGLYSPGPPSLFTDCSTATAYRLAGTGPADSLVAVYPRLELARGEPVGVTVEGATFAAPDGTPTLRIEAFHSLTRSTGCGEPVIDQPLDGIEWLLTSVLGSAVPGGVEATLVFDREVGRVSGSTGCNNFSGSYEVVGTLLSLGSVGMTRMACPAGLAQLEVDVTEAFRTTGSYRIIGNELQLLGEGGPVAVYRARPVPGIR